MNMNKEVVLLNIKDILPNRFQPRIVFDDKEITELADSIKEYGVIQPIVVRKIADKYEIIAGERRYKASKVAGKTTIPAIITDLNDKDSAEIALIENVQRSNLTPIEEAISYKKILDMGYLSQSDLALKLGKTQSTIANKLRLLNLSEDVQEELLKGKISERHARSLLRLSKEEQEKMVKRIIEERLTVRRTDEEINKILHPEEESEKKKIIKYILDDNENKEEKGNEIMENQEAIGSFNIPNTPIINSNDNNLSQNNESSSESMSTVPFSPITSIEPATSINSEASTNSIPSVENTNNVAPQDGFNPFSTPAPMSPVEMPSQPTVETPIEVAPPVMPTVAPQNMENTNNVNTNPGSNVDPTNPEPVSGGKFFNMFSETENNANNFNGDSSMTSPSMSTPVTSIPTSNSNDASSIFSSSPSIVSNTAEPSSTVEAPTENIEGQTPFSVSSPTSSVIETAPVSPVEMPSQPTVETPIEVAPPVMPTVAPQNVENTQNTASVPSPFDVNLEQTSPVSIAPDTSNTPTEPISIDTVSTTTPEEIPDTTSVNMTPLQTYRLNDDQTFENSSVVELGTFGGTRAEEPVLQPLRVEENKQPKASMKEVINAIRECSKNIENMGYEIDTDEMDLQDSYQVTFKIMKEDI